MLKSSSIGQSKDLLLKDEFESCFTCAAPDILKSLQQNKTGSKPDEGKGTGLDGQLIGNFFEILNKHFSKTKTGSLIQNIILIKTKHQPTCILSR